MPRYRAEVETKDPVDVVIRRVERHLESRKFVRGAGGVWQKGRGLLTSPLFLAVTPRDRSILVEGWVRFTLLPGVYLGEMGIDGLVYAVPKRMLAACIREVEALAAT